MEYPHANANGAEAPQALAGDKSISATRIDNGLPQEENIVAAKSDHLPNVNRNPEHESTNGNLKTTALSEINPNTVTSVNGASSKQDVSNQTDTQPTVTPKKVTIVDVGEEDAGGDPSLERVLPDGEDQDDGPEDDQNANPQMGIGTKKKKKRKPKSKRGLVIIQSLRQHGVC